MKKINLLIMALILSSCSNYDFYQVFKTNYEGGNFKNNKIVFEDKNCIVSYNLWGEGGDLRFKIYNKTESDLTINLTKSFFVLNGVAYEYFQNRIFSKSSSLGISFTSYNYPYYIYNNVAKVGVAGSSGVSTSYIEKPELTIPANTSINISEYQITNSRYCGDTLKFNETNSPFVFSNLITYTVKGETSKFENKFYVSEISEPISANKMENFYYTECKGQFMVVKYAKPDKFYIKYTITKTQ